MYVIKNEQQFKRTIQRKQLRVAITVLCNNKKKKALNQNFKRNVLKV